MALKELTVNGKPLSTFDDYDGTTRRATSRRLLAYGPADGIEEGGGSAITIWIRDTEELHWRPPEGWTIDSVSFFGESDRPAVAIDLVEDSDE